MKDIPVFTGAHGIATIVLKEIPWSGCGYVIVRSVWDDAAAFLQECLSFCRACGAEQVYASWALAELPAPHAYDMVELQMKKSELPQGESLEIQELTKENSAEFLAVYNRCFQAVPNAASYSQKDTVRLLGEETAYLVFRDGVCAAIAEISREGLEAVAVLPEYRGLGYDLTRTVLEKVPSMTLKLKTASTNERALRLYERLGFQQTAVLSRWWKLM